MYEDVRIAVINEGPYEPTWFWDGKDWKYPVSHPGQKQRPRVVPYHIAYEHWAVEIDEFGNLRRATQRKENEKESQFDRRIASLVPKVFLPQKDYEGNTLKDQQGRTIGNYGEDPAYVDWYTKRVHFKLKRIPQEMTLEEFEQL